MNIAQQIVSLQHIVINAKSLQSAYPKDEAIKAMLSQSQFMITKLQKQQESELQDQMFIEREIRVQRFRDGGSANYYLMPQNVKVASFNRFAPPPSTQHLERAVCYLSGRCIRVNDDENGRLIAQKFIQESVGIILDEQGDFIGYVPKFKRKYSISIKPD